VKCCDWCKNEFLESNIRGVGLARCPFCPSVVHGSCPYSCSCLKTIAYIGEYQEVRMGTARANPRLFLAKLKSNGWIKRLSLAPRYHTTKLKDLLILHQLSSLS